MASNKNNKNLPNSHDLNKMFLELGDDSSLAQIRRYVWFHLNYLVPNKHKLNLDTKLENNLYNSIAGIEPDVFFNTYYSDYFALTDPFSHLCSFFPEYEQNSDYQCAVLFLLYLLIFIKERYPNECLFFQYHKLKAYPKEKLVDSYNTFCDIWIGLFVLPIIRTIFTDLDFYKINYALFNLGVESSYSKALIILYIVLYRDYRKCERTNKTVAKLRDDNDKIDSFDSAQAIFTFENKDESKPRFLNKLFKNTFSQNLMNSQQGNWKSDFSIVLKSFEHCSLDFLLYYFIPEVFPSISTVIAYLSNFPSSRNHSVDRKIIEIICAYLYSLESSDSNKIKVFKNYLDKKIYREGLSNYEEIYNKLEKLHTSYAVINYTSDNKYKRAYEKVKPMLKNSSDSKAIDKTMLGFYSDTHDDLVKNTSNLSKIPALNFLIENQNNCKDSQVEDGILFEETANRIFYSNLRKIVLLQPSYSFLLKWLSDYRTKNMETTVVIYNKDIVDCLNIKFHENNLISKSLYYSNQSTSFNLHIVNSIESISEYDLAVSFHNKIKSKYEDLVELSRLLSYNSMLMCVLPHNFFETDENEIVRRELISSANIKKVTYFSTALFGHNPKKKYFVEFGKENESKQTNDIPLRLLEIDSRLHGGKANQKKSDDGIFYIDVPPENSLKLDSPYVGEIIDFLGAYQKQTSSKISKNYNKAQQISFAPDFCIYYNATNHGNAIQAKCFFAKYLQPSKKALRKKPYGAKIEKSKVTISAKDDTSLEEKIISDFPFSDKFEKFRDEAAKEIKLALKEGRLTNISMFSFVFSYADEIKKFANRFDYNFCYNALCKTTLGSLIFNDATQEDFDRAISELISSTRIDSEKLYIQLEIILKCADKKTVLFNSNTPIYEFIETRKKQVKTKAQLRDAFTKKTLDYEEEKRLIYWLLKRIPEKPAYLGTMIKLMTGMTNPEVSMLTWGDFCSTDYSKYYHLNVTKQRNYKSLKEEALSSPFKYRVVPIPVFLSNLIFEHKERIQKNFKVSEEKLIDLPIITNANNNSTDFCSPNMLRINSKKALKEGAMIPENIVSYLESDGAEEHDLSKYNGDFFAANFKYHALNDAMMTLGEVYYILGLVPRDTFSKHYCDYTNPFLQIKLVDKLNDWCSLYSDSKGAPKIIQSSTKSDLKRNITIDPYNSGCTSGQLLISVNNKCISDIDVTVTGNRGIKGTATVYEENKNAK